MLPDLFIRLPRSRLFGALLVLGVQSFVFAWPVSAMQADGLADWVNGWVSGLGVDHRQLAWIGVAGAVAISVVGGLLAFPATRQHLIGGRRQKALPKNPDPDDREMCLTLVDQAASLWRDAEAAVLRLDQSAPIRTHLLDELRQVEQRLSRDVNTETMTSGALTTQMSSEYWRLLRQRLRRTIRDLDRILATALAAIETLGDQAGEQPRIPKTRDEALLVLGASQGADAEVLGRLVKALRQCWHPDLAQTDADRVYRDARLTQINVAYDILTGRRVEG